MDLRSDAHAEQLAIARAAHGRRDWLAAYEAFGQAGAIAPLETTDLAALAAAAWQLGHAKESVQAAERVFSQLVRTDPPSAAMQAIELGLAWLTRGDLNIAQGWMNRARRLLEGTPEGPADGYLAYLDAVVAMGDPEQVAAKAQRLREICARIDAPELAALCHVAEALAAIGDARLTEAYALIDEALLPVMADQVPIDWAGDIFCIVLNQCHHLADFPRMRAWTQSMERWCNDIAASANYGGVCDVHRLQLLAATDDYGLLEDRLVDATRALEGVNGWAAGEGYCQLGEVRRLRGDVVGASDAFARARALGADTQPGEALLRCSQGDVETAWTDLRLAFAGADRLGRMRLLRGAVEVALARDDVEEADRHCKELEFGAESLATPGFRGWAAHARGAILVRRGLHAEAIDVLQGALREYRTQESRYELAQVYALLATAHEALGDGDLAAADSATSAKIYRQIGVQPALSANPASVVGGLTRREVEVLQRISGGATNRAVAEQLVISEKTVGRHLANIYAKVGVSSRTAAVAWARESNLI